MDVLPEGNVVNAETDQNGQDYRYITKDRRLLPHSPKRELQRGQSLVDILKQNLPFLKKDDYNTLKSLLNLSKSISLSQALAEGFALIANNNTTPGKKIQPTDVPWIMLHKLLTLDAKGRLYSQLQEQKASKIKALGAAEKERGSTSGISQWHGLDVFLLVFLSCDLHLRQALLRKMVSGRLAVPLLFAQKDGKDQFYPCMSFWALQSIVLEWTEKGKHMENTLSKGNFHSIGFMKFGSLAFSKSGLINQVLDIDRKFETFLDEDVCSDTTKKLSNGLVETAFYLPSGKEDFCRYATMISNLRGDAMQHKYQAKTLTNLSNLLFILVNFEDLSIKEIVQEIKLMIKQRTTRTTFLVVTRRGNCKSMDSDNQKLVKIFPVQMQLPCPIYTYNGKRAKQRSVIAMEIRDYISVSQPDDEEFDLKSTNLTHIKNTLEYLGINTDMDNMECTDGFKAASGVIDFSREILANGDMKNFKSMFLKLQGSTWSKISMFQKEKQHLKRHSDVMEIEGIDSGIETSRETQIEYLATLSPFMHHFLEPLGEINKPLKVLTYMIQSLKLHFEDMARTIIPPLREEYKKTWQKGGPSKSLRENTEIRTRLENLEKEIQTSVLGVEHIVRELAQMFEAYHFLKHRVHSDKVQQLIDSKGHVLSKLHIIASQLFLCGFPVEIMDGDVENIPIVWITNVFNEVKRSLKKSIIVISVIGFQSSGKSTLLNAMFGCDFAVSAGRCTRGVFMQLVQIKKGVDAIVIDTEGMKAPELGTRSKEHDNMLATLAIGLGDVSLVNIKGENPSEMTDVLQIVAHAFLRMKLVNKHLNLYKRCIFVHQNAASTGIEDKTTVMRKKFLDILDEKTREVAGIEGRNNISSFTDVIKFDYIKDIWFFPNLWDGNLPMAVYNPGYCHEVLRLKQHVLSLSGNVRSKLSTFADHLSDLWKAILTTDFVFNFRNTQALKEYYDLEQKYYSIYWRLEAKLIEKTKQIISSNIRTATAIDTLLEAKDKAETEVQSSTKIFLNEALADFESYEKFNNFLMERWANEKYEEIHQAATEVQSRALDLIRQSHEQQQFELEEAKQTQAREQNIIEKVDELVRSNKKGKRSKQAFSRLWDEWINEHLPRQKIDYMEKATSIVETNLSRFIAGPDGQHLNTDLANITNKHYKLGDPLVGKLSVLKLVADGLITPKDRYLEGQNKSVLNEAINSMLLEAQEYVQKFVKEDAEFDSEMVSQLIKVVTDKFDKYSQEYANVFKWGPAFRCHILVQVCRWATPYFANMDAKYDQKKHDILRQVMTNNYYWKAMDHFTNVTEGKGVEEQVAALFVNTITSHLKRRMLTDIPEMLQQEFKQRLQTKQGLLIEMLEYLCSNKDIEGFKLYLKDAKSYARKWIEDRLYEYARKQEQDGIDRFTKAKIKYVQDKLDVIENIFSLYNDPQGSESPSQPHEEGKYAFSLKNWIFKFCQGAPDEIGIPTDAFTLLYKKRIDNSTKFISSVKENIKKFVQQEMQKKSTDESEWPVKLSSGSIMKSLWGCEEICPFCFEPCMYTNPRHAEKHSKHHRCLQHRIWGVSNYIGKHSESDFDLQTCSWKVADKGGEVYNTFLREGWDVEPDGALDSANYWKWFLYTFRMEVVPEMEMKNRPIPNTWKNTTEKMARESIKRNREDLC